MKITKENHIIAALLAVVILIEQIVAISPMHYVNAQGDTEVEYSIDHKVNSSWNGGCNAEIIMKNISNAGTKDWSISFSTYDDITDIWGGKITECMEISDENDTTRFQSYYRYTVKAENYTASIASGAQVNIGYNAIGDIHDIWDTEAELVFDDTEAGPGLNGGNDAAPVGGTYIGEGYTVDVVVADAWEGAYNVKLKINNTSEEKIHNWGFVMKTSDKISGLYNAVELSDNDGVRLIKNAGYNQDIAVGGCVEVGYTAFYETGADVPQEFALSHIKKEVDSAECEVSLFVTDEWEEGGMAQIIIENTSDQVIEDWILEFDSDMDMAGIWGGVIESHNDEHYFIRNADYAQNIPAEETQVVGILFNGIATDIHNVKVSQIVVNGKDMDIIPTPTPTPAIDEDIDYETDTDEDGIPDAYEEMIGTDPAIKDTDNDGVDDYVEVFILGSDPLVYDSIEPGISDSDADIDGDGIGNAEEISVGLDPINRDTDYDGLEDDEEIDKYVTDPLDSDTDDDGLKDGDEIKIGLDPRNPVTYGTPDSEYIISQSINEDSPALADINTDNSVYQLSLSMDVAGCAEKVIVKESRYSETIKNEAIIGSIPEIYYDGIMNSMTVVFHISDEITEQENGGVLNGLHRFSIGYYYEDEGICLPIQSSYNDKYNTIYLTGNRQGTYCLFDLDVWYNKLSQKRDFEHIQELPAANDGTDVSFSVMDTQSRQLMMSVKQYHSPYNEPMALYSMFWGRVYKYNGHTYMMSPYCVSWEAAKKICEDAGGHLLTINSEDEQAFIENNILKTTKEQFFWLGGYTNDSNNQFNWITGESFDYFKWRNGFPYKKGYSVLEINSFDGTFGTWANCTDQNDYVICEWEPGDELSKQLFIGAKWDLLPEDYGALYGIGSREGDYDNDGVSNFTEISFDDTWKNYDSKIPTLEEMYEKCQAEKPAIDVNGIEALYSNVYYLPVKTDPLRGDTDGDGIKDYVDIRPSLYDDIPDKFVWLINDFVVDMETIKQTDDGFTLCMTSLYEIYDKLGYPENSLYSYVNSDGTLGATEEIRQLYPNSHEYYIRDWYFYAVSDKSGDSYGILLLRPYRPVYDKPCKVAIPFVEVDKDVFLPYNLGTVSKVKNDIRKAINADKNSEYSKRITLYFSKSESSGGYIIANEYVNIVIVNESHDNKIDIVIKYSDQSKYRESIFEQYDKEKSDNTIDIDNNDIWIKDINNISDFEKKCILVCRTNNPSQNSFVAEIVYHAGKVIESKVRINTGSFWEVFIQEEIYSHAICADLNLELEKAPYYAEPYKEYDGVYVVKQRQIHGDK